MVILVLNCGSSSIKYQVIDMEQTGSTLLAKGLVERIGLSDGVLTHKPSVTAWRTAANSSPKAASSTKM